MFENIVRDRQELEPILDLVGLREGAGTCLIRVVSGADPCLPALSLKVGGATLDSSRRDPTGGREYLLEGVLALAVVVDQPTAGVAALH